MAHRFEIGDICVVDAEYIASSIAAIYLLRQDDTIAIIETGTVHSLKNVKAKLESLGLGFEAVKFVIPTHVHLDHAGGAGKLMQLCPNAKLVIHPKGMSHMVDPSKLTAGTIAVYGKEKFNELYGEIVPIDKTRMIVADDGFELNFSGRKLKFIDTKGHARHHFCVWDETSESMFTGDTFGISYPEFDVGDDIFIFPTTTPVQFEPEELVKSIDKIMAFNPKNICLTHFGIIKPNRQIVACLKSSIESFVSFGEEYYQDNENKVKIKSLMLDYLVAEINKTRHKLSQEFIKAKLATDVELNTQGLLVWQSRLNHKK